MWIFFLTRSEVFFKFKVDWWDDFISFVNFDGGRSPFRCALSGFTVYIVEGLLYFFDFDDSMSTSLRIWLETVLYVRRSCATWMWTQFVAEDSLIQSVEIDHETDDLNVLPADLTIVLTDGRALVGICKCESSARDDSSSSCHTTSTEPFAHGQYGSKKWWWTCSFSLISSISVFLKWLPLSKIHVWAMPKVQNECTRTLLV